MHIEEAQQCQDEDAEGERQKLCADADHGAEECLLRRKAEDVVGDELPAVVFVVEWALGLIVVAHEVVAQDAGQNDDHEADQESDEDNRVYYW